MEIKSTEIYLLAFHDLGLHKIQYLFMFSGAPFKFKSLIMNLSKGCSENSSDCRK